jgi:regulator of RNase E activity RraA
LAASFVERLALLDACSVSDAKDSLGLPAAVSGMDRQSGDGLLTGRVKTVELVEGVPPADMPKVHLGARAILSANAETVIVADGDGVVVVPRREAGAALASAQARIAAKGFEYKERG